MHLERNVDEAGFFSFVQCIHPVQSKPWGTGIQGRKLVILQHRPAHHHLRQLCTSGSFCLDRIHQATVPQHGDALADGQDFVQFMGDENAAMPFRCHLTQNAEQIIDFAGREHRRRFVEDEDGSAFVEGAQNLDSLLFAHRKLPDGCMHIHAQIVVMGELIELGCHIIQIQPIPTGRLHAERNILNDRQRWHQHEMLMDHANPLGNGFGRRVDFRGLAIQ